MLRFVAHNPRFRTYFAKKSPDLAARLGISAAGRLAFDEFSGLDPNERNDLPAWPADPPPIDLLRAELSKHLYPDDVDRAERVIAG
jgi:hypothetical protein